MRICSRTRSSPVTNLRHRMLDLKPRVHLDEIELAVLVQELDGADAEIAELGERARDHRADFAARRKVEGRRGRFLPYLLMAALQRAVALAQMKHLAVRIGDHLDLDMTRLLEIFLDIDRVVAERGLRFGACGRQRLAQFRRGCARPSCRGRRRRPPPSPAPDSRSSRRALSAPSSSRSRRPSPARSECRALLPPAWPRPCRPSAGCARASGR